eukprot:scaffold7890_cov42-Phaeocystis_antarctica.AAC.1
MPPPRTAWSHRPSRELTTPAPQAHRLAWAQREAARGRGGTTIGRSADGLSCRAGGPGQLLPKVGLRRMRRQAKRWQLQWTRWRAVSEPPRSTASCLPTQMPSRRGRGRGRRGRRPVSTACASPITALGVAGCCGGQWTKPLRAGWLTQREERTCLQRAGGPAVPRRQPRRR